MLKVATLWGAEALGQSARIGSLRAGKQADVILVRADAVNTAPVHDPYATVITQAHPGNIDTGWPCSPRRTWRWIRPSPGRGSRRPSATAVSG